MLSTARIRAVCLWAIAALATSAQLRAQRYTFRQYGAEDGLSNLSVNCLLQDRAGYLWVGTDNGLFRYDGSRFKVFSHAEGLANSEIKALVESPEGVLWVATEGGLAHRAGAKFQIVAGSEKEGFEGIAFDRSGTMYLLEHSSAILRGAPDGLGSYRFSEVARGSILSGLLASGEDVWFGGDGDLWRLSGGKSQRVGSPAGLPRDQWAALAKDAFGNLWARSPTRLYELPQGQNRFVDRSEGIPHASRPGLFAGPGGLFVSSNSGAVILDGVGRTYIDPRHGLPSDAVAAVLLGRDGSLWLGMFGGGVVRRLGHGEWLSWKKEDGLPNNSVWSILHDRSGRLWVGTSGGLSIFGPDGTLAHSWTGRKGLVGDWVRSILEGQAGDFFVGTFPGGISRFSKEGLPLGAYGAASGLKTDQVGAMVIDRQGRLWVEGAQKGLFRSKLPLGARSELRFERVDIPGIDAGATLRDMLVDEDGAIWISTSDGVARFDGGRWRIFREADGLRSRDVSAIAHGRGDLWLAYRDSLGIARLRLRGERAEVANFDQKDGLSSDLVYALAFDSAGRLWATTDNGVDSLDLSSGEGRWHRYGKEDGLIWNDGNDLALSADAQGNVWVGTSGGLSRYAAPPGQVPDSPSSVVLTSIEGGSQEFQDGDRPALKYSQDSLLIRFSALDYSSEASTRFRYRLLGSGTAWKETLERSVHFDGLPGGSYVFEVIAAGPNGLWSPKPARFAFSVMPPWWQSWWFRTAGLFASTLVGAAIWRLRVRALMAQKRLLERQVAAQTAELRESHRRLEEIAYYDMLTSLPNRRMFAEQFRGRLALARRHCEPFALVLIDLDHFKQINDTFGHDAGDAVLIETAVRLRVATRESDCVARLGGDEFAILLMIADGPASVEAVCRRIIEGFAAGIRFNDSELKVGCSVGVAVFPEDGDTQEALYKSADLALYEAKRTSGNIFCRYGSETEIQLRSQSA